MGDAPSTARRSEGGGPWGSGQRSRRQRVAADCRTGPTVTHSAGTHHCRSKSVRGAVRHCPWRRAPCHGRSTRACGRQEGQRRRHLVANQRGLQQPCTRREQRAQEHHGLHTHGREQFKLGGGPHGPWAASGPCHVHALTIWTRCLDGVSAARRLRRAAPDAWRPRTPLCLREGGGDVGVWRHGGWVGSGTSSAWLTTQRDVRTRGLWGVLAGVRGPGAGTHGGRLNLS